MQNTDAPKLSIVIVCMNRPDNLYPCLQGIKDYCTSVSYETLVVAYLFDADALAKAKADFPWVTFIESGSIRGFSENNNLALRQARGEYCLILNDDTVMDSDVPGRLVADFGLLPGDAAIVSPRILNADGSLQLCGRPPYPARNYFLQQWHLYSEPIDDTVGKIPVAAQIYRTSNITGAAFMIRTDIFRELGFFDERYFFTPEDIALSTLARRRGYGVYVDSACTIVHKWKTTVTRMQTAVRPAAVKGSLIFFGGDSPLKRFLLSLGVYAAESSKRLKAWLRRKFRPTPENAIKHRTFRNICRAVFSSESPKELFIRHYHEL